MITRVLVVSDARAAAGPYGINNLRELGYELVQAPPARSPAHRKLRDVIEHRTHFPSEQALRSVLRARKADLVLAFLESHAQVPSVARARRIPPYSLRPLAMIACWLADDLRRLPAGERLALARRYRGVDLTMVFSANQIDVLVDAGFRGESVESIPFGFAPEQHAPATFGDRSSRIAAVGFDRGRDYRTLFDAVRGTDLDVDLYCKQGNIDGLELPSNVTFHGLVPYDDYRRIISTAGIVAVPTHRMEYPSGQTVALEAAATGACLALTATPALSEYFSPSTALMSPAGDADAWRQALVHASADRGRRETIGNTAALDVRARFTYRQMWEREDLLFRSRGWVTAR